MKKILSIVALAMLVVLLCPLISAATTVNNGNVTYWYPWVMDGKEIKQGQVTISDEGIVKKYSGNWEIKAQDLQDKITKTYMSPATVWTKDTTKDFYLTFEVKGGSNVKIGFLHCIGKANDDAGNKTVAIDGTDLGEYVKMYSSVDGTTWKELKTKFIAETADKRTPVLINGMTGYDKPIVTNVGDGTAAYNEFYFIADTTVPKDATMVKYVYFARQRSNYWDPVIRDAKFTAPKEGSEVVTGDESIYFSALVAVIMLGISVAIVKKRRV